MDNLIARRTIVRYAIAVGCTAALPVLPGCSPPDIEPVAKDSSTANGDRASPAPSAPASEKKSATSSAEPNSDTDATQPTAKISQAQAKYQNSPNGEQNCANCVHFVAESKTCKLVEGSINPDGWCMLWAKA